MRKRKVIKYDEFNLDDEQLFSRQHHARLTEDGYLTIYDNGVANKNSRAIKIKIDEENKEVIEFNEYSVDKFYKYTCSVQEIDSENEVFLIRVGIQAGVDQDLIAMEKTILLVKYTLKFHLIVEKDYIDVINLNRYVEKTIIINCYYGLFIF